MKRMPFRDFVKLQRGFDLPKSQMRRGKVPVLGSNCIIGFHDEAKAKAPGVVTGRSGTLGRLQYSQEPFWPHNTAIWVRDFQGNNPRFVYYKLQTLHLEKFNGGVSVPTLNRNVLDTLPVDVPEPAEQCRIASILSTYDDLLTNNQRRIQLLEQSARLLYKEWFVYLRFPGHERTKIKDGVPDGWSKGTVGDFCERRKVKYSANDEGLPLVDLARIRSHTLAVTETGMSSDLATARIIFETDDILFNSIRPYLHKVVIAPFKGITNVSVFVVRPIDTCYQAFTALLLSGDFAIAYANQHTTGTKMPVVKWNSVESMPVLIPSKTILGRFETLVGTMVMQIKSFYFYNRRLACARDLLLPRFVIGQIKA